MAALPHGALEATATLDVDAPLVESPKQAATRAYDGTVGYPPVVVGWAEQAVVGPAEFRAGHVPAGCGNVRVLERAVAALPAGIPQLRGRAERARYESAVLRWCEAHGIEDAIRADLSEPLHAESLRLPAAAWQLAREDGEARREWAEVPSVPDDGNDRKDRPCVRRSPVLRVTTRPGDLFADGRAGHHFAVVTTRAGAGLARLQWHRAKAGPVEHTHHVRKHALAAAAWFRLTVLTYTLLMALKRLTLPGDFRTARPKRLRFLLFNTVGRVVSHARRTLVRLTGVIQHALMVRVRHRIAALASA